MECCLNILMVVGRDGGYMNVLEEQGVTSAEIEDLLVELQEHVESIEMANVTITKVVTDQDIVVTEMGILVVQEGEHQGCLEEIGVVVQQSRHNLRWLYQAHLPQREIISNSSKNGKNGNTNSLFSTTHGGSGVSSSPAAGHELSSQSKDAHVKLSIKSSGYQNCLLRFQKPQTVASLKRTVMEAVAAIIGEGLHLVGLGFALEPNPTNGSHLCPKEPPYLVQSDVPQLLTRYPLSPSIDAGLSNASPDTPLTNLTNCVESDHDYVLSPTDMRPFSVHEVEALVHAVEKLGTGRGKQLMVNYKAEQTRRLTRVMHFDWWHTESLRGSELL
ncbi:hypothetical protein MKW98_013219 [Papaver atlanticum]|uniref:Telomere repeat-binding protein 1-6-like ubiquitin-like domain-containing protein n=1 Tax=Papaver atlanticum TaxID=357466 RepID=A0AAD4SH19_9MAGN|nr:hypothetical protein MKW98_013219 [Papaver atlanticum]